MKKLTAILFLSVFLCANTEVGQLLKLPTLIHHYLAHHDDKTDDEYGISFINFLKKHYNKNDNNSDNAQQEHQDLPFKTIGNPTINTAIALEQPTIFATSSITIISSKNVASYIAQHYTHNSFGNIWQPPKLG